MDTKAEAEFAQRQHGAVPALEFKNVSKSFGGAQALRDVSLSVAPGEVHGLLGENGSGKSTLIKVLAGFHAPDEGDLVVRGEPVGLPLAPGRFRSLGIEFVPQDLGLIPTMTVVENLRFEQIAQPKRRWLVSWRDERRRAKALFAKYDLALDPSAKVSTLQPVERALLAIVRALEGLREIGADGAVLVLDEPTAFLSKPDRERLFGFVRTIAATGGSILLVSHDLDEIRAHTDRVTVLRDGRAVGTAVTRSTSEADLVAMIIGREFKKVHRGSREEVDETSAHNAVVVDSLVGGRVQGVSFTVGSGEVLGMTGQIGAGFEDVPYLLFGATKAEGGDLTMGDSVSPLASMSPTRAIGIGMALVPADRQQAGCVPSLTALDNMMSQVLSRYFRKGLLRRRQLLSDGRRLFTEFEVRPGDPTLRYSSFSGGNQQKALMAKWLQTEPTLLLLHEPTIGVDIGARQMVFGLMRRAAQGGTHVLVASNDHEQLADVCDRVLVFSRGRIVDELTGEQITKEYISQRCFDLAVPGVSTAVQVGHKQRSEADDRAH
jgi:ribose transport system ATP-binding protein